MKKKIPYILMGILLLAGLTVLFYPAISNWYNAQYQIQAVVEYNDTVAQLTDTAIAQELARAKEYNEALTGGGITDPFIPGGGAQLPEDYTAILDAGSGVMGTLEIPKIDVNLPIYHGTGTQVLEKGVGHMEMTAFPIGGEGNHSVLTGHTALPTATLFSGLNKLEVGDGFYIKIYNQIMAYRVDNIVVVEPSNTRPLMPEPGKDYVSLVTCTPYAVNSHRLLVRGVRIFYTESDLANGAGQNVTPEGWKIDFALLAAAGGLVVVVAVFMVVIVRRRQREKRREARHNYFKERRRDATKE